MDNAKKISYIGGGTNSGIWRKDRYWKINQSDNLNSSETGRVAKLSIAQAEDWDMSSNQGSYSDFTQTIIRIRWQLGTTAIEDLDHLFCHDDLAAQDWLPTFIIWELWLERKTENSPGGIIAKVCRWLRETGNRIPDEENNPIAEEVGLQALCNTGGGTSFLGWAADL